MTKFFTLSVLALLSVTIFSCKDDDEVKVDPAQLYAQAVENLTTSTWHHMRSSKGDGQLKDMDECIQQSDITFTTDGNYVYNKQCGFTPVSSTGYWKFSDDLTAFTFSEDADPEYDYILVEITEDKMLLQLPEEVVAGGWQLEYIAK